MENIEHNEMDQQTVTWTVQTASTWDRPIFGFYQYIGIG